MRSPIVFTNGCFDILHAGHVDFLKRAKELADSLSATDQPGKLVVGINTDASIRRLKGPQRPIVPLEDRIAVLESLEAVDLVMPFHQDTPLELILMIRPDLIVKGGDYHRKSVVGFGYYPVKILPYVGGKSSSEIIEKIRRYPNAAIAPGNN